MKAIIFDIDGTLIESMSVDTELYFSSVNEVLGPVRLREKLNDYEHVTDTGILAQLLTDNGLSFNDDIVASVQAVFVERMRRHIHRAGPFPVIDGALDFFETARNSCDRRVAIATGGWRQSALLKLDSAGFNIDGIPLATSDDSPSRIEIMRCALAMIDEDCESVTYIGDAGWDRRACRRLGWDFVAVGPELGGVGSFGGIDL